MSIKFFEYWLNGDHITCRGDVLDAAMPISIRIEGEQGDRSLILAKRDDESACMLSDIVKRLEMLHETVFGEFSWREDRSKFSDTTNSVLDTVSRFWPDGSTGKQPGGKHPLPCSDYDKAAKHVETLINNGYDPEILIKIAINRAMKYQNSELWLPALHQYFDPEGIYFLADYSAYQARQAAAEHKEATGGATC